MKDDPYITASPQPLFEEMTVPPITHERPIRTTRGLPTHLAGWQLPHDWRWGSEGLYGDFRHHQEVIDSLGRSLSLVTAPDAAHHAWLRAEALQLAHRSHPSIPTTYHYWTAAREAGRGPGYLRRWVSGEAVTARLQRLGPADIPYVLQVLRGACSTLAYLHTTGVVHGALTSDTIWLTPTGRLWMLEWQWAVTPDSIPAGVQPELRWSPTPPEWSDGVWSPTAASDQWQLAAMCFTALTGEPPPAEDVPPVKWLRPECPDSMATAIDRALLPDPTERFASIAALLRVADRGYASRVVQVSVPNEGGDDGESKPVEPADAEEQRVRAAVSDDYEILSRLGEGTFGTVWRARDLSLEREIALKVLHPSLMRGGEAVAAFWREARLAAQLAHPAIVPIYDWDGRDELTWYTMELAEGGSLAELVERHGPRQLSEVSPQVDLLLDGLSAAHAGGIIHRDLKPENVLIDRYRRWRLTDFGIANVSGENAALDGATPAFAAPEQLLGEAQGPQVDCFAMAAIVAYVLSGELPFKGPDAQTILAQQLAERADLDRFTTPVAEWLRVGLAPDPRDRFADAGVMRDAWRVAVAGAERRSRLTRWLRSLRQRV